MSQAQLQASIRLAKRWNRRLRDITRRLGTKQYPRGAMLTAYRNARRATAGLFGQTTDPLNRIIGITEIMAALRAEVTSTSARELQAGVNLGQEMAEANADIYNLPVTRDAMPSITSTLDTAIDIAAATVDRQDAYVRALILAEAEEDELLGNERHPGILNPSAVVRDVDHWAAHLVSDTFGFILFAALARMGTQAPVFEKIPVAIRDMRTTETCQKVDGQAVLVDKLFDLNGWTPAYADEMMFPPFHYFCRTGIAIGFIEDLTVFGAYREMSEVPD